jgi:ATP-dependent protease ClpP protease subunit
MGSGILMAADKIRIERPSVTMFHDVIGGARGTISLAMNRVLAVNEGANAFLFKRASLILTEDEIDAIRNKGKELFLSASQMTERLKEADLLEEVKR